MKKEIVQLSLSTKYLEFDVSKITLNENDSYINSSTLHKIIEDIGHGGSYVYVKIFSEEVQEYKPKLHKALVKFLKKQHEDLQLKAKDLLELIEITESIQL